MRVLRNWLAAHNISLSEAQLTQLNHYQSLVLEANEKMNLTAITDPGDFTVKHFIDSLSLLPWLPEGKFRLTSA
jgi:16S rRNA (guanine527-N7)-methyltransferase